MSVETDLMLRLQSSSSLAALVSTRIEPVINAQSGFWPALSYQQISGPQDYTHDGPGMAYPRFQLTATGTTFADVVAVMSAVRALLDGRRWGAYTSFCENQLDSYAADAGQQGVYIRRLDVVIWYGEV